MEQRLPALLRIARELEDHYQAPVKIGWTERRLAQALLQRGFQPKFERFMWCTLEDGWRVG